MPRKVFARFNAQEPYRRRNDGIFTCILRKNYVFHRYAKCCFT